MKKKLLFLATLTLTLPAISACKNGDDNKKDNTPAAEKQEPKQEEPKKEDPKTDKMPKAIADQCAAYNNEQEAQICAVSGDEIWSVYCYDGDAFSDYSENCAAKGMNCKVFDHSNGKFGLCSCTSSDQCETDVANAQPFCTDAGECHFKCDRGYHETTVKIDYEDSNLSDIKYKCAEDYEVPADVGSFCDAKTDGYYCFDSADGDNWQIYCDKKVMDQGYSQNCTTYDEVCQPLEKDGKIYNICQIAEVPPTPECQKHSDCEITYVENAHPACNMEHLFCTYECNDGYTDDFFGGCELIEDA